MTDQGLARPVPLSGIRRLLYVAAGCAFVGLAVLGFLLPILPTTPFLLLASFFFVRSSPRLHARLLQSRIFGSLLRDWQKHRGVRPRVKFVAVVVLIVAVALSALLASLTPVWLVVLLTLGATGLIVVLRLPVIREQPEAEVAVEQPQDERLSA